jgi:hypothetical protein
MSVVVGFRSSCDSQHGAVRVTLDKSLTTHNGVLSAIAWIAATERRASHIIDDARSPGSMMMPPELPISGHTQLPVDF